jgi:hypothetical protein
MRHENVSPQIGSWNKTERLGQGMPTLSFRSRFLASKRSRRGPELLLQFLSHYYLAAALDQHGQNLKQLLLDSDLQSVLSKFTGAEIHLEGFKAKSPGKVTVFCHGKNVMGRKT